MRQEGDAVIEDGLGPEHEESDKSDTYFCGGNLAPLSRTRSLGYMQAGGHGRPLAPPSLKYAHLSPLQKQEIKFPPRTFDYLRDDIRQNLIDLINFKISREQQVDAVEQTTLKAETRAVM